MSACVHAVDQLLDAARIIRPFGTVAAMGAVG